MPKRTDLHSILIIGSGPIVIAQACEFDYAGVQACKALKEEGYRVILVNSNPATIMTDPELADATYIEPLNRQVIEEIIYKEKIDALLPTMGGQISLNLAMELFNCGKLQEFDVELIGACPKAIEKAENRKIFNQCMRRIGIDCLKGLEVHSFDEVQDSIDTIIFPLIIRPSFTLGGIGSAIVHNVEELEKAIKNGVALSPVGQVLIEESVIGWKEFEMEVMRDYKDQCVIICSIENIDPMGVHTGDSITVAPALTLTDKEYQKMREATFAVIREIGVATGGANVQFAVNPETGRMVVIEMNPRVSRSSALASKATGFPIAKIAAKLAVGYSLEEIQNEITKTTYAAFEPSIDYIVTKIPRFDFEKFSKKSPILDTHMQSIGEVMAIGATFTQSLQKALNSIEQNIIGLECKEVFFTSSEDLKKQLSIASPHRIFLIAQAFRQGLEVEEVHTLTSWDPWFLREIKSLIDAEAELLTQGLPQDEYQWRQLKYLGFSDKYIARLMKSEEKQVREARHLHNIRPTYRRIDSCAGEFASYTAYLYSCYLPMVSSSSSCEAQPSNKNKIIVLGSGPNRIGQGIEFDYCCVHACEAFREEGFETIMINCNPETVSTDYSISDRLYFSPLDLESLLEIIHVEQSSGQLAGVAIQFGGQTALRLAEELYHENIPLLGTSFTNINRAENRGDFKTCLENMKIKQLDSMVAYNASDLVEACSKIGFPIIVRPSYVLGGTSMSIIKNAEQTQNYISVNNFSQLAPLLIESFLEGAKEVDIDLVADEQVQWIAAITEHLEPAGIHSGDSTCALPTLTLSTSQIQELAAKARLLAKRLNIIGFLNIQFAIHKGRIFIIEANPRASRTIPFISKALGVPIAKIAAKVMIGKNLSQFKLPNFNNLLNYFLKHPIFSFERFEKIDARLGPIMKSTGEVMARGADFKEAMQKIIMPYVENSKHQLMLVIDSHYSLKEINKLIDVANRSNFKIYIFQLSHKHLINEHVEISLVDKNQVFHIINNREIDFILGSGLDLDDNSCEILTLAYRLRVPILPTLEHALTYLEAREALSRYTYEICSLQDIISTQKQAEESPTLKNVKKGSFS